jgi:hypothetical protein
VGLLVGLWLFALVQDFRKARHAHEEHWRRGFTMTRRRTMKKDDKPKEERDRSRSPYRKLGTNGFLMVQIALLAAIAWVGWNAGPERLFSRPQAWLIVLALMTGFAVVAGRGITGYWRGILIDKRYKMSLSRFQLLVRTLVVLSALLTAVLTNVALGSDSPLSIEVPVEIWVLLGISVASAVGSKAVLKTKERRSVDPEELDRTADRLQEDAGVDVNRTFSDTIIYNCSPEDARWGDLLKGDEAGNASVVELGKLQMFFFTFVLVLTYATAIAARLEGTLIVTDLPPIDETMNTLLGISHTGYLADKSVSHTRTAEDAGRQPA